MNRLGKELWRKIEYDQGYAYISDAILDMDDKEVIKIAKSSLINARKVVIILENFLKEQSNE